MLKLYKDRVEVCNQMGVNKVVLSHVQYSKLEEVLQVLTGEELLDLQHLIRYPKKGKQ